MSDSSPSIIAAVAQVRKAGIVVVKTGRNTGINSDYATYADVWHELKPHLDAAGLSVGFLPSATRLEGSAWIQTLIMEVAVDDSALQIPFEILFPEGNRGVNLTQRQGMAHTYGKRYALIDYFHIITGDDDDAERLGQPTDHMSEASPDKNAHWRQFCYCDLFEVGDAESKGGWSVLSSPANPEQMLGDLQPAAIAALWMKFPEHAGVNAWRAELINERSKVAGLFSWEDCVTTHKTLNLPKMFAECTGEQLNNLALALKPKK